MCSRIAGCPLRYLRDRYLRDMYPRDRYLKEFISITTKKQTVWGARAGIILLFSVTAREPVNKIGDQTDKLY